MIEVSMIDMRGPNNQMHLSQYIPSCFIGKTGNILIFRQISVVLVLQKVKILLKKKLLRDEWKTSATTMPIFKDQQLSR